MLSIRNETTYPNSRYWTGTSLQLRLLLDENNLFKEEQEEESLLIYTAQGSLFRYKKLSVINGSPEHNNVQKLLYISLHKTSITCQL